MLKGVIKNLEDNNITNIKFYKKKFFRRLDILY